MSLPPTLPNRANAFVPREKIVDYLLSFVHPVGRHKARVFRALGFHEGRADDLERRLLAIAHVEDVREVIATPHGVKYVLDGVTRTPSGAVARLRTVWIIETDDDRPRLVTAYPLP